MSQLLRVVIIITWLVRNFTCFCLANAFFGGSLAHLPSRSTVYPTCFQMVVLCPTRQNNYLKIGTYWGIIKDTIFLLRQSQGQLRFTDESIFVMCFGTWTSLNRECKMFCISQSNLRTTAEVVLLHTCMTAWHVFVTRIFRFDTSHWWPKFGQEKPTDYRVAVLM